MSQKPFKSPNKVSSVSTTSGVRNSAIPKIQAQPSRKEISREVIAKRAYEIWQREGGSERDNWLRAERELRGA